MSEGGTHGMTKGSRGTQDRKVWEPLDYCMVLLPQFCSPTVVEDIVLAS